MKLAAFLTLWLALSSCGGKYQDPEIGSVADEIVFGSEKARVLDSANLIISGSAIEGTGSLIFSSRYEQFLSGGSYSLGFTLEDGGSLTLVSHSNEVLAGGFNVEYRREGSALKVTFSAQGNSWAAGSSVPRINAIDAAAPLSLQLDLHNDENPAHLILWNRLLGDDFTAPAAILNSAAEIDGSPGIGNGTRWGLILVKAKVTQADRSEPKLEH